MTNPGLDPLATELTLTIGLLAKQRARLRNELQKLHSKFTTGGFPRDSGWTSLEGLVAACTEDVANSVFDLDLQRFTTELLAEVGGAARSATAFLESGLDATTVVDGEPTRVVLLFAVGDVSDPDTAIEDMDRLRIELYILAFRVGCVGWLVDGDVENFWGTEFMNRMRASVRGPVTLGDEGGFRVEEIDGEPEESTPPT